MQMSAKAKLVSLAAVVVFTGGAFLWASGCDFTHVDAPAEAPLADILVKLESAHSEKQATAGVDALLGKLEIGTPGKQGAYSAYSVSKDGRAALARVQAAYVRGELDQTHTFREAYAAIKSAEEYARTVKTFAPSRRPLLGADVTRVMEVLSESAEAALAVPEDPKNALLVALVAVGGQIPSSVGTLEPDQPLSPVRRFLFGVWLHQSTPGLFATESGTAYAVRTDCRSECEAEYTTCTLLEGQYSGANCELLQACLDACEHPQGRVYNP